MAADFVAFVEFLVAESSLLVLQCSGVCNILFGLVQPALTAVKTLNLNLFRAGLSLLPFRNL